jgi:hypothetical protein
MAKPLAPGPISLHAARSCLRTCPVCGARSNGCVTSHDGGQHVAKITFVCGHGENGREGFIRRLKVTSE